MKKNTKDFLNGDYSFKNWFKIMLSNGYILRFLMMLVGTIIFSFYPNILGISTDNIWRWILVLFFSTTTILIAYKGFYQKWKDLKEGKSK